METTFKVFCLAETGTSHTNRYARFSIPERSVRLRFFFFAWDNAGGLFYSWKGLPPVLGFSGDPGSPGLLVLGVWGFSPASLDNLITTTRDRFAKIRLVLNFSLGSRGVRNA